MSAAEHQSPNTPPQPLGKSLKQAPQRPSLLQPPARPVALPVEEETPTTTTVTPPSSPKTPQPPSQVTPANGVTEDVKEVPVPVPGKHPISPPSEPMQYRAIGLIRGTYTPSEEQLNRGLLVAEDGAVIEAVLLGRITSLLKKHLDLTKSHLWVVYPRTRIVDEEEGTATEPGLHAQIVGVWEPETLGMPGENPNREELTSEQSEDLIADEENEDIDGNEDTDGPVAAIAVPELPSENYFSIRGEVLACDEEQGQIVVKIVQGARRSGKPPKAFRLNVLGHISGKTVGYFWEFDVTRQGEQLTLIEGRMIAIVPPKKKKGKSFGKGRGGRRPYKHTETSDKPSTPVAKEKPRIRLPAPVKSNPL